MKIQTESKEVTKIIEIRPRMAMEAEKCGKYIIALQTITEVQ